MNPETREVTQKNFEKIISSLEASISEELADLDTLWKSEYLMKKLIREKLREVERKKVAIVEWKRKLEFLNGNENK